MIEHLKDDITKTVAWALEEDIRDGDITAALIPGSKTATATIITREHAIICGIDWVTEVFQQVDDAVKLEWHVNDGDAVKPDQKLVTLKGKARSLMTGERCALNFLQTLSGTATRCRRYADMVKDTTVKLLDTRKTIPGLRTAQKYAVSCGGCYNHRIGLYDAYLIKENHIAACGGIANAVATARKQAPGKPVEVEVENLEELEQALNSAADTIMLDNFSLADMRKAVEINTGRAKLEASGGVTDQTLRDIAETGVDYISIGVLTKDFVALDLSMRVG
ncbi:MAG: carboxylating nicotinate-nucleotide diphosphorylase [Pseudomonadales bacterium]|nr:carboxylating nicotinate-nucleotide diphosphorylase [Pseudomonadales bacterium]